MRLMFVGRVAVRIGSTREVSHLGEAPENVSFAKTGRSERPLIGVVSMGQRNTS